MSVREYIGARYVPIFVGQWDNTQTYEPLTVVQYQGNSFISRQYVPVGIDINNEDFWIETGNYNAQVEAYRQEVLLYAGQMQSIKEDVATLKDSEMEIHTLSSEFGLTLVKVADLNIVFECGSANYPQDIIDFFAEYGVERIDVLVITHYHSDHYSGFATVAQYCDSDTDIYVQMETPSSNDDYQSYVNGKNFVDTIIASNGLQNSVTPLNNTTINYGKVEVTFYNTDPGYSGIYEASWANTGNAIDYDTPDGQPASVTRMTSLNNYSLVTRIEYNGNTYVDCGDVEGAAQKVLAPLMQPTNVMSNPHHLVNRMGWLDFYNNLNPDTIIATHNKQGLNEEGTDVSAGSFFYYYIFRLMLYSQNDCKLLVNLGGNIDVILREGELKKENGGKKYSYYSFPDTQISVGAILPPNYYDDNPYCVFTLSLDDFYNVKLASQFYPKYVFRGSLTSGYLQMKKMQFIIDLGELFQSSSSYDTGKTFFIDFYDLPRIKFHSTDWNYNVIELLQNFTMADFRNHIYNFKRYSFGDTPININGTWNSSNPLSADDYRKISNAENVIAVLDLGNGNEFNVPMSKFNGTPMQGAISSGFDGISMNTTGTALYNAHISTGRQVNANRVLLSNMNVTEMTVKEIIVIR